MFCVWATTVSSEQVFSMAVHVVNSRKENLNQFVSQRHALFQQCCKNEAFKVGQNVSHFYLQYFLRAFVGFEMNH